MECDKFQGDLTDPAKEPETEGGVGLENQPDTASSKAALDLDLTKTEVQKLEIDRRPESWKQQRESYKEGEKRTARGGQPENTRVGRPKA